MKPPTTTVSQPAQSGSLHPICSPSWCVQPTAEAYWWDGNLREWGEVTSTYLVVMVVSDSWRGAWWGPFYPPEVPRELREANGDGDGRREPAPPAH